MELIPLHDTKEPGEVFEVEELTYDNTYDTSEYHKHAYFEFFFFTKGGGSHSIDFKPYEIENNTIHFVFPNQVHQVVDDPNTRGKVLILSRGYFVDKSLYISLLKHFYLHPSLSLQEDAFIKMYNLIQVIEEEYQAKATYSKEIAKNYIDVLFRMLMREQGNQHPQFNHQETDFHLFVEFLQLMEENYSKQMPVSFYSTKLGLSDRKLNAICKSINNATCSTLLSNRLILEAKKLLINSEYSIKEILYSLNYNDPAYFHKFFKSKTGKTPGQFRDEITK